MRRILADRPTRRIATVHDAFGYFAAANGLEIAAVFEPFPGREPGLASSSASTSRCGRPMSA